MGNVVSFHKGIDRLTAENLIRIDKPVDEGIRALTQPCYLRWSDGTESQAYLKIFGSNLGTCIINEITGFLIGKACNLPLPNKLGMLQLPEDFVKANQCCEWAIAVSEVPGKTLKMIYKDVGVDSFAPIFDHLFEWSRIEDVLAFDDWIANGDRNIGNVVIAGSSSYYLIDHSDALVKSNWSIGDLDPSRQVDSVLAEGYRYNSRACSDKRTKLVIAASTHSKVYSDIANGIEEVWQDCLRLMFGDDSDKVFNALKNFIQERANDGAARIQENPTLLKAS